MNQSLKDNSIFKADEQSEKDAAEIVDEVVSDDELNQTIEKELETSGGLSK